MIAPQPLDREKLAMPAGGEQQQVGKGRVPRQPRGERMALQVIDRHEGPPAAIAIALPAVRPTITPPIRPGPPVAATPASCPTFKPGVAQRRGDREIDLLDMGARGDFRHDAAEGRVLLHLAPDHVRQNFRRLAGAQAHDRGCGFVAARLDAENSDWRVVVATADSSKIWCSGRPIAALRR